MELVEQYWRLWHCVVVCVVISRPENCYLLKKGNHKTIVVEMVDMVVVLGVLSVGGGGGEVGLL